MTPLLPSDSIDVLALPSRARNALHREGITTVAALTECEPADLLDIRTVGAWSVDAIRVALDRHGLTLADRTAR